MTSLEPHRENDSSYVQNKLIVGKKTRQKISLSLQMTQSTWTLISPVNDFTKVTQELLQNLVQSILNSFKKSNSTSETTSSLTQMETAKRI